VKRSHRLLKDADFQTVLNHKKFLKSQEFTLYGCKQSIGHTRVGLSVGKKVGNAVVRNKIRRQIRMMLSTNLDLRDSIDYIVMVRNTYLSQTFQNNQTNLLNLFENLRRKLIG
jgi:ribonuclease P protein component